MKKIIKERERKEGRNKETRQKVHKNLEIGDCFKRPLKTLSCRIYKSCRIYFEKLYSDAT